MPFEGEQDFVAVRGAVARHLPALETRAKAWAERYRWQLLLIALPTLLAALYLWVFAANQYVSEASFLVRSSAPTQSASALGAILGGQGLHVASEESAGVADYLVSHDAAMALQSKLDIVSMYRRSGIDLLGRIKAHPREEELTRYYQHHVSVALDDASGIIKLQVRAFRPEDSKAIADTMLVLGEQLVNRFSERAQGDAVRLSLAEVDRTKNLMLAVGGQLTQFRDASQSLDPTSSSQMVMTVMGGLEGQLAAAKAEFGSASAYLKPGSPRLQELSSRVAALQSQVANQKSRLTGGQGALAPTVAGYDRLMVEREFAMRDYASAMTAYETARMEALKQHLYLVRVVEPNLAQKSLYPQRWMLILTVFVSLLVAYAIGWLIIAGVREHAA